MQLYKSSFTHKIVVAWVLAIPVILNGCSFSDSSGSISESSGTISESPSSLISSPFTSSSKDGKYSNQVSEYTMAYVKSSSVNVDYTSFLKGLSDIANKNGIVNWDQEPKTYIAIGKGLKKAGSEGITYETFKKNFANSDPAKMQNIQKGYDAE